MCLLLLLVTLLYLLLWPFSLRVDARLSPTSGRAELRVATFFRLRFEGDFLQPPYLKVYRLDRLGRRRPLSGGGGFIPRIRFERVQGQLYVGLEEDGALTAELLGLLFAGAETGLCRLFPRVEIRPWACFDKTICALGLTGIGRFTLAQNILEYRKGRKKHAKR